MFHFYFIYNLSNDQIAGFAYARTCNEAIVSFVSSFSQDEYDRLYPLGVCSAKSHLQQTFVKVYDVL